MSSASTETGQGPHGGREQTPGASRYEVPPAAALANDRGERRRRDTADVAGVPVDTWPLSAVLDELTTRMRERRQGYVCVTSIHGLVVANEEPDFRETLAKAALVIPDGIPLVWAARLQGFAATEQITGFELVHGLSEAMAKEGRRAYYYGGPPGMAERMAQVLERQHPGLGRAGCHTPPFRALDDDELRADVAMINRAKPDVIWVGLPTPKQERWMRRCLPEIECPVAAGVGGAFDFVVGDLVLPPKTYRRLGLGWVHRAVQKPAYWRRSAYTVPRFGFYYLRHWLRSAGSRSVGG
jgi:N-acetylglucosaminyldiphosphoundecaprenol N-acetyl-beta-D-mannosaminyltransferase